jgi:hypothetical protein
MVVALSLVLAGCSYAQPVMQPSGTLLLAQLPESSYRILGVAEGEACGSYLFPSSGLWGWPGAGGGISLSGTNTYAAAVKAALRQRPGAEHLLQATTDVSSFGIPLLYRHVCVEVRGIAVQFVTNAAAPAPEPSRGTFSTPTDAPKRR